MYIRETGHIPLVAMFIDYQVCFGYFCRSPNDY